MQPMSNLLKSKLAALINAGDFRDGVMHLGPSGNPAAMALILQAIDNTILQRNMTFSVGTSFVVLNVGGRRLRAFVAASDDLTAPTDLAVKPLSLEDKPALLEIGTLLEKLTIPTGSITLMRSNEPGSAGQPDAGIAIDMLTELWGVDPDAKPPTKHDIFIAALGSDFVASIDIADDGSSNPQGDLAICDLMEGSVLSQVEALELSLPALQARPCMAMLEGLLPDGMLTCLVKFDETATLVAVSPNAIAKIAIAWGRI
jgi:hypothetical protein